MSVTGFNKRRRDLAAKVADAKEAKDNGGDAGDAADISSKSAKELYKLCIEKSIVCEPKKPKEYYLSLLEEDGEKGGD